jgi:hypothetical protein
MNKAERHSNSGFTCFEFFPANLWHFLISVARGFHLSWSQLPVLYLQVRTNSVSRTSFAVPSPALNLDSYLSDMSGFCDQRVYQIFQASHMPALIIRIKPLKPNGNNMYQMV